MLLLLICFILEITYAHFSYRIQERFANTKESAVLYQFATKLFLKVAHTIVCIGFSCAHKVE